MAIIGRRRLRPALAGAAALAYLVLMVVTGALPRNGQFVAFEAAGVLAEPPEAVTRIRLAAGERTIEFLRRDGHWHPADGTTDLTPTLSAALDRAVEFMHAAKPVRVLAAHAAAASPLPDFGLAPPRLSIRLANEAGVLLAAEFGGENTDGILQYMRLRGHDELYLMSGFVGREWQHIADTSLR